jgi:hypothetical protein
MKHHNLLTSDTQMVINQSLTVNQVIDNVKEQGLELSDLMKELPDVIRLLEQETKTIENIQVIDQENIDQENIESESESELQSVSD